MNIKYLTALIVSLSLIAGYALYNRIKSLSEKDNKKLHVLCTTNILGDTIKKIAGESIDLEILMLPGVDPHTYKPIEPDMRKIAQADLIIYNGLHLEARMSDLFDHLKKSKEVLPAGECIPKKDLICIDNDCSIYDPHIWLHPLLWIQVVTYIAQKLGDLIPDQKEIFEHNSEVFINQIQHIYQTTLEKSKKNQKNKRFLVTSHDAFSYFAQAYNFTTVSLQGINTASETGLADMNKTVEFILNHKIPTIFIESSIPGKTMQAIQERVKKMGFSINLGDELYSDSLSPKDGPASTYIDMIHYNVNTIINGLD